MVDANLYTATRKEKLARQEIPGVERNYPNRSVEGWCVRRSSTMSWWRRVQQAFVKPSSPSSLKKNASENLSFLQKKYGDLAKDKGEDLRKSLKTSVSDYGKQAKSAPQDLKARSVELGRQARVRAEKATSGLGKQLGDSARALPSRTVEVCCSPWYLLCSPRGTRATSCCTDVGFKSSPCHVQSCNTLDQKVCTSIELPRLVKHSIDPLSRVQSVSITSNKCTRRRRTS